MKKCTFLILFLLPGLSLWAQETLIDIAPSVIRDYSKKYFKEYDYKSVKNADTLELPFFDDFSNSYVFANQAIWDGHSAFINNGYAIDPISIGVASLDILDSTGAVYTNLSFTTSLVSEYLTSKPINLQYSPGDSVYLSFYYQCGGTGEKPDVGDSLVLEFSSPDTTWVSVWNTDGGVAMDTFQLVLVPVTDPAFLKKGFRFRFKNYASIGSNYEPSFNSNFDIWNIDYVRLDTARNMNDTITQDVAFISDFTSMIDTYESVPWEHFKPVAAANTIDSLVYVYKNNGTTGQNINRQLTIRDLWGTGSGFSSLDDSENILPGSTLSYGKQVNYVFNSNTIDSACFELKGFIKTDTTAARRPYRWNDTIIYNQCFYNYYAYDDGSAEQGYGIAGQGTAGSAVALMFEPLQADTLRGVNIFFNQVLNDANIHYFYLMVWENDGGVPGDTLVEQIGVRPIYTDSLNEYRYYALDTPVFVSGAFFIGWVKTTDDMLNVGFDKNRDASSKLLYNTDGNWTQSSLKGAIMVRPVFGKDPNPLSIPVVPESRFVLYPNPASNQVNIASEYGTLDGECFIYDCSGRLQFSGKAYETIDVSQWNNGLYIVHVMRDTGPTTLRLVVSH
ncbi:MAG TPA: T9SS type A sorting domain-containing protein [Bacteroidales bacterium]|nr:T9SS type A sorting domain-containing protein [Bacteroidales bacterium]